MAFDVAALGQRLWAERLRRGGALPAVLDGLLGEERAYLGAILGCLSGTDLTEYDGGLFLTELREALLTRKTFPWARALSEGDFFLYVAFPRVGDEELCGCRGRFREALSPRILGLTLPEVILEVNRWCAEQVTYRSTDERTLSAWEVFERGFGRCGEESLFAVTALRSVGVAARQVYCPWWSHCDDNHAWVEAFDGTCWRYLGACEPEPVLDRGWFTAAAGRAVALRTRIFLPWAERGLLNAPEEALLREPGCIDLMVTDRYAAVRRVEVLVRDRAGAPVPGAWVELSILNMGAYLPMGGKETDPSGRLSVCLGAGSVQAAAYVHGRRLAEGMLDPDAQTLVLSPEASWDGEAEFDFLAPMGSGEFPPALTEEEKSRRERDLSHGEAMRKARPAPTPPALSEEEARAFAALSEKDRLGMPRRDVLADGAGAYAYQEKTSAERFEEGLLSQRIGREPLRPWRKALAAALGEALRGEIAHRPEAAAEWVRANFSEDAAGLPPVSLAVTLRRGRGSREALAALTVGALRASGVPARLGPDGFPEADVGAGFAPLPFEGEKASVTLSAVGGEATLAQCDGAERVRLRASAGETATRLLPAGRYRALIAERLPAGNQLVREVRFTLWPGETREICLSPRKAALTELLTAHRLPVLHLRTPAGDAAAPPKRALLCWLEPGREPTEHLLNELLAAKAPGLPVRMLLSDPRGAEDPLLRRVLAALPDGAVWYAEAGDAEETARRCFLEPGRLPLCVLWEGGVSRFSLTGYRVGAADLLMRMAEAAGASGE